jgi:CubicO group peptidase (beta-lactamase class C family)
LAFGQRYYGLMWWRLGEDERADFFAVGDHGQYVYVSPSNDIVIVRMGVEYGVSSSTWVGAFSAAADGL